MDEVEAAEADRLVDGDAEQRSAAGFAQRSRAWSSITRTASGRASRTSECTSAAGSRSVIHPHIGRSGRPIDQISIGGDPGVGPAVRPEAGPEVGRPANTCAIDIHSRAAGPVIESRVSSAWRRWVTTQTEVLDGTRHLVDGTLGAPHPTSRRSARSSCTADLDPGRLGPPERVAPPAGDHPELGDVDQTVGRRTPRPDRIDDVLPVRPALHQSGGEERPAPIDGPYQGTRCRPPACPPPPASSARPARHSASSSRGSSTGTGRGSGRPSPPAPPRRPSPRPARCAARRTGRAPRSRVGGAVEVGQVSDLVRDGPARARRRRSTTARASAPRRSGRAPLSRPPGRPPPVGRPCSRPPSRRSRPPVGRAQRSWTEVGILATTPCPTRLLRARRVPVHEQPTGDGGTRTQVDWSDLASAVRNRVAHERPAFRGSTQSADHRERRPDGRAMRAEVEAQLAAVPTIGGQRYVDRHRERGQAAGARAHRAVRRPDTRRSSSSARWPRGAPTTRSAPGWSSPASASSRASRP